MNNYKDSGENEEKMLKYLFESYPNLKFLDLNLGYYDF